VIFDNKFAFLFNKSMNEDNLTNRDERFYWNFENLEIFLCNNLLRCCLLQEEEKNGKILKSHWVIYFVS